MTARFGVANEVEPVTAPVLAKTGGSQQTIDLVL